MILPVSESKAARDLAVLALLLGAAYFLFLGRAPLGNPDEGRYAEIPREMVASGDWVTPRLNGVAYFEKPPLVYWCTALALETFGPREGALRATPILFALGGIGLTYATARRMFGAPAGLAAAGVLGTSIFYFAIGRLLLLDMVVSALISATLFCFILGVREAPGWRRRSFFHGLYVSAALATLAKGLIGFLLPGAVMFLWLLVFNQWSRLRPLYLPTGLLLFFAIAVPWHVLAATRNPSWAHFYFVHEHWERFTSTTHGRFRPWWFFVPLVVGGLFPWSGFLPGALRTMLAGGWRERKRNADAWFFVVWAGFIFLFFSASQSKLPPYILPVFPPLAVLIGAGLARTSAAGARAWGGMMAFAASSVLLAAAFGAAMAKPEWFSIAPAQAATLLPAARGFAAILIVGAMGGVVLTSLRGLRAGLAAIAGTTAIFLGLLGYATRDIQPGGTKELALFAKEQLPPGVPIFHYHDFFHDFAFYAERFVGTVEFHGDELELVNDEAAARSGRFLSEEEFRARWLSREPMFVIVRKKKLAELQAELAHHPPAGKTPPPVLIDRQCRLHTVRETADYFLFCNRLPHGSKSS